MTLRRLLAAGVVGFFGCAGLRNATTAEPTADAGAPDASSPTTVRVDGGGTFIPEPDAGPTDAGADPLPPPTCDGGLCTPELFAPSVSASRMVFDGEDVFLGGPGFAQSGIQHCTKSDCSTPATIVADAEPQEIAVAGNAVYWIEYFHDAIHTCPRTGCTGASTVLIANKNNIGGLVSDGTSLYWTTDLGVYSCPLSNCGDATTTALFSGSPNNTQQIVLAKNTIFWANSQGQILACPTTGICTPSALATSPDGAGLLSTDGENVFWISGQRVAMCAVTGCNHAPTFFPVTSRPTSPHSDGSIVFFEDSARYVVRCPLTGCPPEGVEVIFDAQQVGVGDRTLPLAPLATDADYIYFFQVDGIYRLKKH